ncbi:MAG: ribonuclease E/G [Candidatus Zixiibacteriota bacterium]
MKKQILINSTDYDKRLAILEDGKLVEFQVELPDTQRMVGDIYKGQIKTVLPGMQAAFVDIGYEKKAAYLHSSDIGKDWGKAYDDDDYEEEAPAEIVRKGRRDAIESVLKADQEILVQVIKEPISTKGPRVATEISLPGRLLVLVPDDDHIRVSKRISNWTERKRLKKVIEPLRPEGFGLIARTEAEGQNEADFRADIKRLLKLWARLKKKADSSSPPALIHKEADMTVSMIRDVFTDDVEKIIVDSREDYKTIVRYARQVAPHLKSRVELYKGNLPLFDLHKVEPDIEHMLDRKVWIKKGAYLIIDQTEAMVTIDVNTGRFVGRRDQEETIFRTNMDAAREAARQIRLRDIGGLLIVDFIDMYSRENRRRLFEEFSAAFRHDRAKRAISPVTDFGIIEMTRERVRPSHMHTLSDPCPTCSGIGRVPSRQNMATRIERWFMRARAARKHSKFHLVVSPLLAEKLSDNGVNRIARMMKIHRFSINLVRDTIVPVHQFRVYDAVRNDDITEKYSA